MRSSYSKNKKAFTLLEMLLALGIFSLLIFIFLEIMMLTGKELKEEDLSDTGENYNIDILEEEIQWAEEIYIISPEDTRMKNSHFNMILYYPSRKGNDEVFVLYYFLEGKFKRWARNLDHKEIQKFYKNIGDSGNIIAEDILTMDGTRFLEEEKAFKIQLEKKNGEKIERFVDCSLKEIIDLRGDNQ